MWNFNGFVESGAFSGSSPTQFFRATNSALERRLAELDGDTRKEVRKHMGDFHSEEEMERFIDHLQNSGRKGYQ